MKAIYLSTASVALAALLFADAAEAATQAGVSAAVRGQVDLTPVVEKVVRPIGSGEDVFLGDALKSHEQSGMQLLLLDETSITMGPNADLTVDEFVYDPATGIGEVTASLAEGVFRFVTGKTSQGRDKVMTLEVPFGVIGVRGTIGAVRNDAAGSLIVLLGPGLNNNADERAGALDVTAQGRTVSLIRPGFGTVIEAGQPPSPPFALSGAQLASILVPLATPPPLPPTLAPSVQTAVRTAQQDTAEAKETSGATGDINQGLVDLVEPFDATTVAGGIGAGLTTFADLPTSNPFPLTGVDQDGVPLSDGGTYDFDLAIDFASRTVGGPIGLDNSEVVIENSPTVPFSIGSSFVAITIPVTSFDQAVGASAGIPLFQFQKTNAACGSGVNCDFDASALISDGGRTTEHSLSITNSLGATASGSATAPVIGLIASP